MIILPPETINFGLGNLPLLVPIIEKFPALDPGAIGRTTTTQIKECATV